MKNPLNFKTYSAGFSLVELLVAMGIIITATTIVLAILTSSFRTSNKTTSMDAVRQNGTHAMSQFSRLIQYADSFKEANDGVSIDFICPETAKQYSSITVKTSGQPKIIACTNENGLAIDDIPLINLQKVTILSDSCRLTCSQTSEADSPVIGVSFELILNNTSSLPEKRAHMNFSTSVKMRNH